MTQDLIEVTQEDRDAAANYHAERGYGLFAKEARRGDRDTDSFLQFVARHRLASTAALRERVEVLEAENERLAQIATRVLS